MVKKRIFITFEGGEGCGKSTISKRLQVYFENNHIDCLFTREPGGNPICESIRNVVLHCTGKMCEITQALLFYASRAQLVHDQIAPALDSGKIVVCDRYFDSSYVYQGYAGGIDFNTLDDLTRATCENAMPTLTFFLDLDPQIAFQRKGGQDKTDRFEMQDMEFHNKVREGFLKLAKANKKRFRIIDSSKSENEVFDQVIRVLKSERII